MLWMPCMGKYEGVIEVPQDFTFEFHGGLMEMSFRTVYGDCLMGLVSNDCDGRIFTIDDDDPRKTNAGENISLFRAGGSGGIFLGMPEGEMREYTEELERTRKGRRPGRNVVSVLCSNLVSNAQNAILMRNWAVEYNNLLLDEVEEFARRAPPTRSKTKA
jgi:hypothetical protein